MTDFIEYALRGVPFGCVFALVAVGLVLTYKTSGVFNLAFGAQAYVVAVLFYVFNTQQHWPTWLAFFLAVVVVAPLIGLLLDWALFRHLRTAPPIVGLVTSLGLLVAVPEFVKIFFDETAVQSVRGVWPTDEFDLPRLYQVFGFDLDGNELATMGTLVVVAVGLTVLFRYTALGLAMRAVVESPRMTALAGINADRVGSVSWMLSSLLAGLAGVLLGPLFARLGAANFTAIIVSAIAAAAFGRLTSIPLALIGGVLLGVFQGLLAGYLPSDSVLAEGLRPSLPFVVLFLILVFWPGLAAKSKITDPLSGVDPPPPAPASTIRSTSLTWATRILGLVVGGSVFLWLMSSANTYWIGNFQLALIYATIFLSIVVITGMAGQISLCQATFAAIGAFSAAQLAQQHGVPVLVALVIGAALAAVVGALLAVPSLRLGGIFLTLATLAFALMFESVLQPLGWVSGGAVTAEIGRPSLGPISFEGERAFLVFCLLVLVVAGTIVAMVRRGTVGRYFDALRGSEVAAASIGINATRSRITAFALSAGIAGIGGALLAVQNGAPRTIDYAYFFGLFWVALVVSLGSRTVEGAVSAGLGFILIPIMLESWIPNLVNAIQPWYHLSALPKAWYFVLTGLAALTYARHPEGVLENNKRQSLLATQRWLDRRAERRRGRDSPDESAPPDAPTLAMGTEPS